MPKSSLQDQAAGHQRSRRGGRTALPPGERRDTRLEIDLNASERVLIAAAATAAALPIRAWARARLLKDRPPSAMHRADVVEIWRASSTLQSNFNQLVSRLNELHSSGELQAHTAAPTLLELRRIAPAMYRLVKSMRHELSLQK